MTTWRVRLDGPGGERALSVAGDPHRARGELLEALQTIAAPGSAWFVDGVEWRRDDVEPIGLGLRHGSLIGTTAGPNLGTEAGVYLCVVAGPDSGRSVLLRAGCPIVIGRRSGDFVIDDPLLSARHCEVTLDDAVVVVRDLGSRNGTRIDAGLIGGDAGSVEVGDVIQVGATLIALLRLGGDDRAPLLGCTPTGSVVQRRFREAPAPLPSAPSAPRPPTDGSDEQHGVWLRALVPLVTAGAMAMTTGRWWFLLIGALSPVVYGYDSVRRVRHRRSRRAVEQARFAEAERLHADTVSGLRRVARRRARESHPGGGSAVLLACFGHRSVWQRRPGDADFAAVTVGYAAGDSSHQGDDAADPLWRVPLTVELGRDGPLGLIGPVDRVRASARALLVDLAFAHAPVELWIWVLTDDDQAWASARWLPHSWCADGGARVATTAEGRAVLLRALRNEVQARRSAARTDQWSPMHAVFVDGAHLVPAPDLVELFDAGRTAGVVGLVLDADRLPEVARAELRFGDHADECDFGSVATPRHGDVLVAGLSVDVATSAALALAPLAAVRQGDAGTRERVELTELLELGARTPDEQARFWREHSPCTRVPVGVTADGAVFAIDVVSDGPHALVGGMTRSGKTEFLKTWLAALAVYNTPDDLSVVLVDFKGGVDHQALATLPHVVALATNQNIDLFERTLALLTAEQQRRQRQFTDVAGVATLEGYRTARQARPALAALPRLLVVVDEFAELLHTPEGRAQLGRLESTARIGAGLGVHLVLLTQMFDHALPPTIDGQAGLRICFKVQHPQHSKVVLGSAVASTIDAASKGRAFVRVQGGELTEVVVARVGNEARSGGPQRPDDDALSVSDAPIAVLALPRGAPPMREVPNELQDLHRVTTLVRDAAQAAGCAAAVVPWPAELPPVVEFGALPQPDSDAAAVIGLADDPSRQRTTGLEHRWSDDLVVCAGSAGSGHHEAVVAVACELARRHDPGDLHLYGIDAAGNGLGKIDALAHTGAVAVRDDATALRILGYLNAEAVRRKGAGGARATGPRIVVCLTGLDRLFLHAEGGASPLLGPLTTLVNEVPGTGIQMICSGSHAMLSNRIGSLASRRLVFAAHDPLDHPPSVPRAARAALGVRGRCFDVATGLVAQVVRPELPGGQSGAGPVRPPQRFARAPWPMALAAVPVGSGGGAVPRLPLGVEPDTAEPVWLDPSEDGWAFRIVGPPKSGRSNALAAAAVLGARCGWEVLVAAATRRSPLAAGPAPAGRRVPVADLPGLIGRGRARPTLVLVDDAHRLDDEFPWRRLTEVRAAPVVTLVAGSADGLSRPLGVTRAWGAVGGVCLIPTRSRDADLFGVRGLPDEWLVQPLAGVGVLVLAGEARRVQFPLVLSFAGET